ncbi:MAG: caspase family protein [Planctomycetes bacterium]|nr:caspase family protein [Planctomycetota bacterium]
MNGNWKTSRPFSSLQLVLGILIALSVACSSTPPDSSKDKPSPRGQEGERITYSNAKYALLVGCTEYPFLRKKMDEKFYRTRIQLKGPVNDVALMGETLVNRLGFSGENIFKLSGWPEARDQRPTKENITRRLSMLADLARPGDQVVILIAGHGVQQPDLNGDELDGLDEVFLPADADFYDPQNREVVRGIVDDRIEEYVRAIRDAGALVWIIMDTCHSGTMVRGMDAAVRFRQLDPAWLQIPEQGARTRGSEAFSSRGQSLHFTGLEKIVAFYASQTHHQAPEMPLPLNDPASECHGLLTYMIARSLARFQGNITFGELLSHLVAGYQALPYEGTIPFAEGDLFRSLLGLGEKTDPSLVLSRVKEKWRLNGGRLLGLDRDTILEACPAGRTEAPPIGLVQIVSAGLNESECRWIEGKEPAGLIEEEPGAVFPARVVKRPLGDYSLRIAVVTPRLEPLPVTRIPERARRALEEKPDQFPVVRDPAEADWLLMLDGKKIWLRPARIGGGPDRFAIGPRGLSAELQKIFRARNLKRLAESGLVRPLDSNLEVVIYRIPESGDPVPLRTGEVFHPGEQGKIVLRNMTGRTYDVTVLFIDSHNGIQTLFPRNGKTARLTHLDTRTLQERFMVNDHSLGFEHLVVIALPRDDTSEVIDLSWLDQEPLNLRGNASYGQGDDFSDLLGELAFGSTMRSIKVVQNIGSSPQMSLMTWCTAWPAQAPPSDWLGGKPAVRTEHDQTDSIALGLETPPDPWRIGSRISLARSAPEVQGFDLLLAGEDRPLQVFIDVDEDSPLENTPQAMEEIHRFEAEAAFHFCEDQRIAFYDRDNDGGFDLILIDHEAGPEADLRFSLENHQWIREAPVRVPWFSTGYLSFLKTMGSERKRAIRQAISKFAVLAGEEERAIPVQEGP